MIEALEQITDALCAMTHFNLAEDLLKTALKYITRSPIPHELIARIYFIMESFDKCIHHNKKAAELQPDRCFHNWSDIGLAYFRLGKQQGNNKHFETAFKFCRQSME